MRNERRVVLAALGGILALAALMPTAEFRRFSPSRARLVSRPTS
jgi:hypothetical protein